MGITNEDEARDFLTNYDLTLVKNNLTKAYDDGGLEWDMQKAESALEHYKGFLFVCWKYPDKVHIPTKAIDAYWHTHIIHTKKYTDFCNHLYGKYLHHTPD